MKLTNFLKARKTIFLTLVVLSGLGLGFAFGFLSGKSPSLNSLPLPSSILANPTLNGLFANTQGSVVEKGADYFTLEKDGRKIKIYVEEKRYITVFSKTGGIEGDTNFSEIKVGDTLNGGIGIILTDAELVGLTDGRKKGDIIGHFFNVQSGN